MREFGSVGAVAPLLAHGLQGPAGGVSALLYLVAALSAFTLLEARDKARTADPPVPMSRRGKIAGAVLAASLVLAVTAPWWVPHNDSNRPRQAASWTLILRSGAKNESPTWPQTG
jgi:multisubunit Na+/H+ antiporter MnhB subunit